LNNTDVALSLNGINNTSIESSLNSWIYRLIRYVIMNRKNNIGIIILEASIVRIIQVLLANWILQELHGCLQLMLWSFG